MDRNGIDRACLVSIGWSAQEHCAEINDFILEAAAAHPERIVPFCVVNPLAGREAAREVERCAALGARGVGELHPDTQGFDLADRHTLEPLMDDGAGARDARAHPRLGAGGAPLPRQGEPAAGDAAGLRHELPRRHDHHGALGRRPALLRAHARGARGPGRRLLRHRGNARSSTTLVSSRRSCRPRRRGPHPLRLRLPAAGRRSACSSSSKAPR